MASGQDSARTTPMDLITSDPFAVSAGNSSTAPAPSSTLGKPTTIERKSKRASLMQIQNDTITAAKALNPVRAIPQRQHRRHVSYAQLALALILPLSLIFLFPIYISTILFAKIRRNEHALEYTPDGSAAEDPILSRLAYEWTVYLFFKGVHLLGVFMFALLSTFAVVYTVASSTPPKSSPFLKSWRSSPSALLVITGTSTAGFVALIIVLFALAVPTRVSIDDFLRFCHPYSPTCEILIIRNDAVEDLYRVVVRFDEQESTDRFYWDLNGWRLSYTEPEVCHILFLDFVEFTKYTEIASTPPIGFTELPT